MTTAGRIAIVSVLLAFLGVTAIPATLFCGLTYPSDDVPLWARWLLGIGAAGVIGLGMSAIWLIVDGIKGMMR